MDGNIQLLLASLLLFAVGLIFKLFPPKDINSIYGYRTARSMKNKASWDYSNRLSATIMLVGFGILVVQKLLFIFLAPEMGLLNAILFLGFIFLTLFLTIFITERSLKNNDDH